MSPSKWQRKHILSPLQGVNASEKLELVDVKANFLSDIGPMPAGLVELTVDENNLTLARPREAL